MRNLAEGSIELKQKIVQDIKDRYNWKYKNLPAVVDNLCLFCAIYKMANISTKRIEEVMDNYMKEKNKWRRGNRWRNCV
jgi:phage gp36-like protein